MTVDRPSVPADSSLSGTGPILPASQALTATVLHVVAATFPRCAVTVVATNGQADQRVVARTSNYDTPANDPLVSLVIHRGRRVLSDVARCAADHGVTAPVPPGSWMGTPLRGATGRTVGAVTVSQAAPGSLSAQDLDALDALLGPVGMALEQVLLLNLLSRGKREWEQTIDAIAQAFCIVGRDLRIHRGNVAFSQLVGVPVRELSHRALNAVLPVPWVEPVRRALAGNGPSEELIAGDRRFTVSVLQVGELSQHAIVLIFEDQTERRRLQEQLIQAEKMSAIGQLIAGVAHDLNNPLASVVGFADYLVEAVTDLPPRLLEPLQALRDEAERAANIVKNLLSFARKQDRQRRAQPIGPILESTLLLLRNELMACKVEAAVDLAPELRDVNVDANQIQQVFVNLLNNAAQAIHASGVGGQIRIRVAPWLDGVVVTVQDDGPGISDDLAERIFEPFFTTKPEGEGTGLGLSICNGIIMEHGGRLTLASTGEGGTTFRVELPGGEAEIQPPVEVAPLEQALRILVIDDEPHIRHYMQAALEAWGHQVTVAGDGGVALERATAEPFDLIISDLRMPRTGGREFYDALLACRPDIASRVIFCTGDTVRGDALTFLEHLGRPYLRKPFTLAELRTALATAGA